MLRIYTYFGSARNVTPVHYDTFENILVCLYGTKRLWLYPPSDTPFVYPVLTRDATGKMTRTSRAAAPPFQTLDELPAALHGTFPLLAQARPVEVNLGPGDVLYLPACWWHCVEGSADRNMILAWWFSMHADKRCETTANSRAYK